MSLFSSFNISFKVNIKSVLNVLMLNIACISFAQSTVQHTVNIKTPTSPEVSSQNKFIDFPVTESNGQANVSIPLYTIIAGDIKLPISVNYHTSGIKVEDVSGWLGTGWSLSAGGAISRTVNGATDFSRTFEYNKGPYFTSSPFEDGSSEDDGPSVVQVFEDKELMLSTIDGNTDSQHDFYHFSIPGYSGHFVFDMEQENQDDRLPIIFPKQDLKITFIDADSMEIITPEGLIYTYKDTEGSGERRVIREDDSFSGQTVHHQITTHNTWHLSRIESSSTSHYIEFKYRSELLEYTTPGAEHDYILRLSKPKEKYYNDLRINVLKVESITSSTGITVSFSSTSPRCDLNSSSFLDQITIANVDGENIKNYFFNYQYMNLDGSFIEVSDCASYENNDITIRPFLKSIQEQGNDSYNRNPPYTFEYINDIGLPSRFSKRQDYWGYFNGNSQDPNGTLIPAVSAYGYYHDGANRLPDIDFAKQGCLEKITFPTGGTINYKYGLNETQEPEYYHIDRSSLIYEGYSLDKEDFDIATTDAVVFEDFEITSPNASHMANPGKDVSISFSSNELFCGAGHPDDCEIRLRLIRVDDNGNQLEEIFDTRNYIFDYDYWVPADDPEKIIDGRDYAYSDDIFLVDGKYRLIHEVGPDSEDIRRGIDEYHLSVRWLAGGVQAPTIAGGLRVESVTTYDPFSEKSIVRNYEYESGYLNYHLFFAREYRYNNSVPGRDGGAFLNGLERTSVSYAPVINPSQGVVSYGKVKVTQEVDGETNGYVENEYYSYDDFPDMVIPVQEVVGVFDREDMQLSILLAGYSLTELRKYASNQFTSEEQSDVDYWLSLEINTIRFMERTPLTRYIYNYPYPLVDSKAWKRGLLRKSSIFDKDGRQIKELENSYIFYDERGSEYYDSDLVSGVKFAGDDVHALKFYVAFYQLESSRYELISTKETLFEPENPDKKIASETVFEYDNEHYQQTSAQTTSSDGEIHSTELEYSTNSDRDDLGVATLEKYHIHSVPLVVVNKVGDIEVSRSESTFSDELDMALLTNVKQYVQGQSTPSQELDYSYTPYGNIQCMEEVGDKAIPYCVIWSYDGSNLVAKIENITQDQLSELPLAEDFLDNLEAVTDNHTIRIQLQELREQLRLNCELCSVTTYISRRGIGVIEIMDANGQNTYYEYDDYGRLKFVRDNQKKILKQYDYHLK